MCVVTGRGGGGRVNNRVPAVDKCKGKEMLTQICATSELFFFFFFFLACHCALFNCFVPVSVPKRLLLTSILFNTYFIHKQRSNRKSLTQTLLSF